MNSFAWQLITRAFSLELEEMGNAKVKTLVGESAENSHGRGSWLSCTLESSGVGVGGRFKKSQASEMRTIPLGHLG